MEKILIRSEDDTKFISRSGIYEVTMKEELHGKYYIKNMSLQNFIKNVDSNNKTLTVTENSLSISVVLVEGCYKIASAFVTALQTALNANAAGIFSVSLSSSTLFLTITNDTHEFTITPTNERQSKILGLPQATTASSALSLSSTTCVNLQYPKMGLFVTIGGDNSLITNNGNFATFYFPLIAGFGSVEYYEDPNHKDTINMKNEKKIEIRFQDEDYSDIFLNDGTFDIVLYKLI